MSRMTKLPGVPDRDDVRPGMASYFGTGPLGSTCGNCRFYGYYKAGKDKVNPRTQLFESRQVKTLGCKMYATLTHSHGPAVNKDWAACKYWEAKIERR